MGYDDPNNAKKPEVGLKDYDALLDSAASETTDLNARYVVNNQKASLVGRYLLSIPLTVSNGAAPVISRLTPFTRFTIPVGDKKLSRLLQIRETTRKSSY